MILLSALLGLSSLSRAKAAPEDCKGGISARLYGAFIINELTGRYEDLRARDAVQIARDPREGCLIWLRADEDIWLARVEPGVLEGARICTTRTRIAAPATTAKSRAEIGALVGLGGPDFGAALVSFAERTNCQMTLILLEDGTVGAMMPPARFNGPSLWANAAAWVEVRLSASLPSDGARLSQLLGAALSGLPGYTPQSVGQLGVVLQRDDWYRGVFLTPDGAPDFTAAICPPQAETLGLPDLQKEEIATLIGFEPGDVDAFLLAVVSSPNGTFDVRSVASRCS